MEINELYKGIYEVSNFLSKEDYEKFDNTLKHIFFLGDKESRKTYETVIEGMSLMPITNETLQTFLNTKIKEEIFNLFKNNKIPSNKPIKHMIDINEIGFYLENQFKGTHSDNGGNQNIEFGIVYYHNEDYEGGEIFYDDLNISIKPKANTVIIHSGELKHHTKVVTNHGLRIVITTFALSK
jgi:hypothetical protein